MKNFRKARKWCVKEVQYSYYQQQMALFHGTMHTYSSAQFAEFREAEPVGMVHPPKDKFQPSPQANWLESRVELFF